LVVTFDDRICAEEEALVGGKGRSLARMTALLKTTDDSALNNGTVVVPKGIVLTSQALEVN
jgi:phosphoenolpyruvate synthase/pyruvate phosphate dikinase